MLPRSYRRMKVLVLSDIHGNYAALEAVAAAERFDNVVCLGDIVGYGPEPGRCARWVQDRASLVVQGNHDYALANHADPGCSPQYRWLADATARLGREQLTTGDVAWLGSLPHWAFVNIDGVKIMCVHATPVDPLYEYLGPDPEAWARAAASIDAGIILAGHTHLQFALEFPDKRIVNPGSVGQPKDGDPWAAYAIIEDGEVRLGRAPYPISRTVSALKASRVPRRAVEFLSALLRTGRTPACATPKPSARAGAPSTGPRQET
jgi:putative phosphoesterase